MNNPDQNSFTLADLFLNLLKNWWKIILLGVLCGLLAFSYSTINPPKYEAEAIFFVSVDESEINFQNLVDLVGSPTIFTQYDLDLARNVVEKILLQVKNSAFDYAKTLDPTLDNLEFSNDTFIERIQGEWFLRYRHEDPAIAQAIVNNWATLVMDQFKKDQNSAVIESFVRVELTSTAERPSYPTYQNRRNLLVAGVTIGLAIGILLVEFKDRFLTLQNTGVR